MAGALRRWPMLRVFHWGPLFALAIITEICLSGLYCNLQWWPIDTLGGLLNIIIYLNWLFLILYNFFSAMYLGPGYVPFHWEPKKKEHKKYLQYCDFCEGYKMPRSHHCRKCGRCVMKMDHHCPWINNCVGHRNHLSFTLFVLVAPMGCLHSAVVLICSVYRAVNRVYYLHYGTGQEPIVEMSPIGLICCLLGIGLAVGVTIAVWILFGIQFRSIIKNETGIEGWIKDKAHYRRENEEGCAPFIYPYDLGRWDNLRMVFHFWNRPELDGYWWPVRKDCNQFTLTMEQKAQKQEKRDHSIPVVVVEAYSGAICPISKGPRVFCCPPLSDEPRIALKIDDCLMVSRWKKRWLYGDKVLSEEEKAGKKRVRGWFPRRCTRRIRRPSEEQSDNTLETETSPGSEKNTAHTNSGPGAEHILESSPGPGGESTNHTISSAEKKEQ